MSSVKSIKLLSLSKCRSKVITQYKTYCEYLKTHYQCIAHYIHQAFQISCASCIDHYIAHKPFINFHVISEI